MDTLLAFAEVVVALDVIALGLVLIIALVGVPILLVACYAGRWKKRIALVVRFTSSWPMKLRCSLRLRDA
jgi:hypothetical protein